MTLQNLKTQILVALEYFFATIGLILLSYMVLEGLAVFAKVEQMEAPPQVPSIDEFFAYIQYNLTFYIVLFIVYLVLIIAGFIIYYFIAEYDYTDFQDFINTNIDILPAAFESLIASILVHIFICFKQNYPMSIKLALFATIFLSVLILVLKHLFVFQKAKEQNGKKQPNILMHKALIFFLILIFVLAKGFTLQNAYSSGIQGIEDFLAAYLIMYLITILFTTGYTLRPFEFILALSFVSIIISIVISIIYSVLLMIFKFSFIIHKSDYEPLYNFLKFLINNSFQMFKVRSLRDLGSIILIILTMAQFVGSLEKKLNYEAQEGIDIDLDTEYGHKNFIMFSIIGVIVAFFYLLFTLQNLH